VNRNLGRLWPSGLAVPPYRRAKLINLPSNATDASRGRPPASSETEGRCWRQGCDSRTRGNHARGLTNSLHAVFTRYLRGNHVRYIYGVVLKYMANTGESVFFLMVGGRRVFKFRAWCASLSLYSLFLSSRPFLPPCACAFSCSVHRHGPWFCAYRQVRNVTEDFEYIPCSMVTSLYSEPIPVTEITSDWRKFHFPRDSRVITCVNLNLGWR